MSSSRGEQQIKFRGICLTEPFRNQEIEGTIDLSQGNSVRFTEKYNSNYLESKSDYNRRSSKQNYNDRDNRGSYNDRSSSYSRRDSSRNRGRTREEESGEVMPLLILLFGLIFFVNLVAGQLMTSSSYSSYERVSPSYQFNTDY
ncbi:MAG: hypothetical protein SXA11_24060 [Cyanobacteriota bacterium]|nr:hypothetical protein [Cyanobacteriota bacterium]